MKNGHGRRRRGLARRIRVITSRPGKERGRRVLPSVPSVLGTHEATLVSGELKSLGLEDCSCRGEHSGKRRARVTLRLRSFGALPALLRLDEVMRGPSQGSDPASPADK